MRTKMLRRGFLNCVAAIPAIPFITVAKADDRSPRQQDEKVGSTYLMNSTHIFRVKYNGKIVRAERIGQDESVHPYELKHGEYFTVIEFNGNGYGMFDFIHELDCWCQGEDGKVHRMAKERYEFYPSIVSCDQSDTITIRNPEKVMDSRAAKNNR